MKKKPAFIVFYLIIALFIAATSIGSWFAVKIHTHASQTKAVNQKLNDLVATGTLLDEPTHLDILPPSPASSQPTSPTPQLLNKESQSPPASPIPSPSDSPSPLPTPSTPNTPLATPTVLPSLDPATSAPISPTPAAILPSSPPILTPEDHWADIKKKLEAYLQQDNATDWNIYIHDSTTNQLLLSLGKPQNFTAASTTKLLTATDFMRGVEKGTYSLDQQIGAFPADFQLEELVNQSDNDSWQLFNDLIGPANLTDYAHTSGVTSYTYTENKVNPDDMAAFLSSLSQGKLLSPQNTQTILNFMHNTEEERFLPSGIPKDYKLYHKVGLLEDLVHDIGIIDTGSQKLSVSIYSNGHGVQDYQQRAIKFAQIGQIIFQNTNP